MASSKRSNSLFDNNTLNQHQPQTTGHILSNLTNTLGYTLSNTLNTKGHSSKLIHIAVVGLSGTEKGKFLVIKIINKLFTTELIFKFISLI